MKKSFHVTLLLLLSVTFASVMAEEGLALRRSGGLVVDSRQKMSFMKLGGTISTTKIYLVPHAARTISVSEPEGIMNYQPDLIPGEINTIFHYDNRVGWTLDTLTKTYTEIDLTPFIEPDTTSVDTGFVSFDFPKDTAIGSYVWETAWDSTATGEDVNGFLCRKYMIRSVGRSSVDENDSCLVNTDFWVCDTLSGRDIYNAYKSFQMDSLGMAGDDEGGEDQDFMKIFGRHLIDMSRKALACSGIAMKYQVEIKAMMPDMPTPEEGPEAMADIDSMEFSDSSEAAMAADVKNMMQSLFGNPGEMIDFLTMSYEISNIERRDLPDSLFVIPDGYTLKEEIR